MSESIGLPGDTGQGTSGEVYTSIAEMWEKELLPSEVEKDDTTHLKWYTNAIDYWNGVPATLDGMMGGLSYISARDLHTSTEFLKHFLGGNHRGRRPSNGLALDCGAGIGRVTKNLLLPLFQEVDMVEQSAAFLEEAKKFVNSERVKNYYNFGLQDFQFTRSYDVVWIQWVVGHLHDEDLVRFLEKCKKALKENGIICVKDNTCNRGFVVDKEDSSVTRSDAHLRYLFAQSGLVVLKVLLQPKFPKKLFPVRTYALA